MDRLLIFLALTFTCVSAAGAQTVPSPAEMEELAELEASKKPVEEREFSSLEKALPHKKKVRRYTVRDAADFQNGLLQLKQLEHLEIFLLDVTSLPAEIGKLKRLKSLKIEYMSDLESFPPEIAGLKRLEQLTVLECNTYEGLEYILLHAPALKHVLVNDNYPVESSARVRAARPDLMIGVMSLIREEAVESID